MTVEVEVRPAVDLEARRVGYRLLCHSCGYVSRVLDPRPIGLLERVHRHRHIVGIL